MYLRFKLARLLGVLLLCLLSFGPAIIAVGTTPRLATPRTIAQAATYTIWYSGLGPTAISLNWTKSSVSTFSEYVLQSSPDGLSWSTFANILDKTNTSIYISGRVPGGTSWWQVIVYDPLSQYSNTLKITQPSTASLSYTQQTATIAQFKWNNNAVYGGFVSFVSYELMESVNGRGFSSVAKIIDESSLGSTASGLELSTTYEFYLNTTDRCSGCGAVSLAITESNIVPIGTPGPLTVRASANPSSVDVGQLVYLSCSSAGGVSPYAYSWTLGDGSSGTGANPSHVYNAPGMVDAVCTVTDSFGTIANSNSISVTVYVDPSIASFTATPASPDLGQRITFVVSASGGNGSLTYSYAGLPTGCSSTNSSSFSCTPTSSGMYNVMATVLDHRRETTTSTLSVSIGPPRVFGLPQAIGLAVIFGSVGAAAIGGTIGTIIVLRRKKQRRP